MVKLLLSLNQLWYQWADVHVPRLDRGQHDILNGLNAASGTQPRERTLSGTPVTMKTKTDKWFKMLVTVTERFFAYIDFCNNFEFLVFYLIQSAFF